MNIKEPLGPTFQITRRSRPRKVSTTDLDRLQLEFGNPNQKMQLQMDITPMHCISVQTINFEGRDCITVCPLTAAI